MIAVFEDQVSTLRVTVHDSIKHKMQLVTAR